MVDRAGGHISEPNVRDQGGLHPGSGLVAYALCRCTDGSTETCFQLCGFVPNPQTNFSPDVSAEAARRSQRIGEVALASSAIRTALQQTGETRK